jgi:hypothetical protein
MGHTVFRLPDHHRTLNFPNLHNHVSAQPTSGNVSVHVSLRQAHRMTASLRFECEGVQQSKRPSFCVGRGRAARRRSPPRGQRGAFSPCGIEVLLAHRITQCRDRRLKHGLVNHEAEQANALPDGLCGAEEPGGFVLIAGVVGEPGQAFEHVGDSHVRPSFGCASGQILVSFR